MDVRIGITTSFNDGEQRVSREYVRAVEQAGGIPLIVPMVETASTLARFVELLHGLVITGGPAVVDGLIGDLPEDISATDPIRVRSDAAVTQAFLEARRPILGICYGMQVLNAAYGGTIYADVQRNVEGAFSHSEKRGGDFHPVELEDMSTLRDIFKRKVLNVNTRHVQAIASVAQAFRVAARAPDGVVEAIENEEGTVLGVQFHPEKMGDEMQPLFRYLVENARRKASSDKDGT